MFDDAQAPIFLLFARLRQIGFMASVMASRPQAISRARPNISANVVVIAVDLLQKVLASRALVLPATPSRRS